jgi:hypothetical protein
MSILNLVPRFMRTWPFLRRYYWQADQIAAIKRDADELQKFFAQCKRGGTGQGGA